MSLVTDEAYSEACEEIESLKARCKLLAELNLKPRTDRHVHKALHTRAADALSGLSVISGAHWYKDLIQELRKAAE